MIDAIIGFSVVSFMIFLPRILVELFKTKEQREFGHKRKIEEKRWEDCLAGKIHYSDMEWYEKLLIPYSIYLKRKNEPEYDPEKSEFPMLLKEIHDCQMELLKCRRDSTNLGMQEAVVCGLSFALKKWNGDVVSFVSKYAPAIIFATNLRGLLCSNNRYFDSPSTGDDISYFEYFTDKASAEGGLPNVKKVYLECLAYMDDPGKFYLATLKAHYIARVQEIDRQIEESKRQEILKEQAEKRRIHKEQLESVGGFKHVGTGDDYESFVMFCVKDAGYACKKVGGSGDYGADLVVDVNGKNLVIQCKFYSTPVGYDAIQQVYAAKSIYKGTWCCVVSNAGFTRQAIVGGRKLGVKLLSHIDIAEYMKSLNERC